MLPKALIDVYDRGIPGVREGRALLNLIDFGILSKEDLSQIVDESGKLVERKLRELLAGYLQTSAITEENDQFVQPPGLGARAGVLGAIVLAERAAAAAGPRGGESE